jgi:hypothetical protein
MMITIHFNRGNGVWEGFLLCSSSLLGEGQATAGADSSDQAKDQSEKPLTEVVVTARKRSKSLTKVLAGATASGTGLAVSTTGRRLSNQ